MTPVRLITSNEEASAECARLLREALAEAEAGRLRGAFIVTLDADRESMSSWHSGSDFTGLLGCVVLAQRDMIENASED